MRSWRSLIGWQDRPDRRLQLTVRSSPERGWSLRLRLLFYVSLALAPIAIASIVQGIDRAQRDVADVRERLVQSARAASTGEDNMLASAEQILRALANLPEVRNASEDCNHALSEALKGLSFFTNITRLDEHGTAICAANTKAIGINASGYPIWKKTVNGIGFQVSEEMTSRVTGRPVISGMLPLSDETNRFKGALAIAIDVRWLDYMVQSKRLPSDAVIAIFDRNGAVIAANNRDLAVRIFSRPGKRLKQQDTLHSGTDANGDSWTYTTSALVSDTIFVGFAMRESSLFGATYVHVGTDFLTPIFMIALAWAAIWMTTERQVTRWILYLRRVSNAYRSGHYALRPTLDDAPPEFRTLGNSLSDMAQAIQDRDQKLRDALAQKSLLIREIHHRVKNNLQVVMSLLSLQAAQLQDPAAQDALKQARLRINALALVHRILHELEDQTFVDLKALLEDLTAQSLEGLGRERSDLVVVTDVVRRRVPGDIAVPLALFAVEALTNIFKHAYPADKGGTIRVALQPTSDGVLKLSISDDGIGFDTDQAGMSVGGRLIQTFGQQVDGRVVVKSNGVRGTDVELIFPDPEAKPLEQSA
ncbi:MAG: ATP-binding protein [Proteobacteria bacterium]|nr:ATP-binding protein [Pseudomonadota bacterium]